MPLLPVLISIPDCIRFEQLLKDERLVSMELSTLEKHIESWSQSDSAADGITKSHRPPVPLSSARDITVDLPPEVAAFEVLDSFPYLIC